MVVNGYYYIPILKKLQVRIFFKEKDLFSSFTFLLGYTSQAACEQATTDQYQYKWGRKYNRFFNKKKIINLFLKFLMIRLL